MDAYERSLKQQADRIRRELSREGNPSVTTPKLEASDEFIPSDVPSPIYGYARPKPKINLPVEHSPETRESVFEESIQQMEETPAQEETVSSTNHDAPSQVQALDSISQETGNDLSSETKTETKQSIGEISILESGFASVFLQSTDLTTPKEEPSAPNVETAGDEVTIEEVAEEIEAEAEARQQALEGTSQEPEIIPAIEVTYQADTPPLNVLMTPQDRMAMYRAKRLAQKNTNL